MKFNRLKRILAVSLSVAMLSGTLNMEFSGMGGTYSNIVYASESIEGVAENSGKEDVTENNDISETEGISEEESISESESVTEEEGVSESESVTEEEGASESESVTEEESTSESESVTEEESTFESESATEEESISEKESALEIKGITGEAVNNSSVETVKKEEVKSGTILQAFCWSFNTIKDNMADIAAAGYGAIQTSPINECEDSYPDLTLMGNGGKWYYHYQPTDWKIGNYQLGTREEFSAMCAEAEKYGIKVIVDILPNHTSVVLDNVSQDLIDAVGGNRDDLYHDTGFTDMTSYSDRLECTFYSAGGLPDVNTENAGFQQYFFEYLKDCIDCGADGFRIDTAKHIALPDDPAPEGVVNNFYTEMNNEVMNQNDLFVYGEVLQGGNERLGAYQEVIGGTTASSYGGSIRTALVSNDYSVSKIQDYQIESDADPSKLVTWVESHDNYLNDGTWSMLNETQIKLGWAIIGAREEGTPLFFSRPHGSSTTNQYGDNTIGIAGSDIYKDDEVAAINKFRTAMDGETENLRNPDNNAQVLMIERGNKGLVIVNGSFSNFALDSETNLANGTYRNMTDDNSVFTVVDGVINGILPARSVVVLYEKEVTEETTVFFYNSALWSNVFASVNGSSDLLTATSDGDGWWRVRVPESLENGFTITFTNGEETSDDFLLNASSGRYLTGRNGTSYTSKSEAEAAIDVEKLSVYFFNNSCWDSVYAYAWGDSEALGAWPGVAAVYEGNYWWRVDVSAEPSDGLNIIFNNNNGGQTGDFVINNATDVYTTNATTEKYASKEDAESDIGISSNSTTVYFYNSSAWDEVYTYVYGVGEPLGAWPGSPATEVGDGWWKATVSEGASMDLNVIFNNNNGSQSATFTISNIRDIYTTGKNGNKYASIKDAEDALGLSSTESTVYYYDTNEWDTTYAYAVNKATNEEYLGSWPGTVMKEDWNGWQILTVPAGASDDLEVTFNNGKQDGSNTFTVNDRTRLYFTGGNETVSASAYTSKILAETALGVKLSTTTVHFYNSDGWENVSAYLYGDLGEAFGGWPGTPATNNGDGWWSIEVPGPASSNLYIIFNDNNNGHQSADYAINDQSRTYTININSIVYASKEEAEAALRSSEGETDVYFYNGNNWSSVCAYVYGASTAFGNWPGKEASDEGNGWWKVTIPVAASDDLHIIFNNNNNGEQSADFVISNAEYNYVTSLSDTIYNSMESANNAVIKAPLESLLSEYKDIYDGGQQNYTLETWLKFVDAYEAGKELLGADVLSKEEVETAIEALEKGVSGLKEKEGLWIKDIADQTYTGKAIVPDIDVRDGATKLQKNVDYTVSIKNNKKVGTATVTVTGKGNYEGKDTATFKIVQKDVATEDVAINYKDKLVDNGRNQKVLSTITYNGITLNSKDYKVEYYKCVDGAIPENAKALSLIKATGDYKMVITGKGNFTGTVTKDIKVYTKDSVVDISKTTITIGGKKSGYSVVCDGTEQKPAVKVVYKGKTVDSANYTVKYDSNVAVGTAKVTITGVMTETEDGVTGYIGTVTKTFKINATKLSNVAKIDPAKWKTKVDFDAAIGEAKQADNMLVAKDAKSEVTLKEGTDYKVSYSKNTKAGKATVTYTGIGKYSGTIKKTFTVNAIELFKSNKPTAGVDISIGATAAYAQKGSKVDVVVSINGTTLVEGKDYKVTYKNNKAVTTANMKDNKKPQVTIKGINGFKGTMTAKFAITPTDLATMDMKAADVAYQNKKGKYMSVPVLTDADGKKLKANKDYTLTYYLLEGEEEIKLDKKDVVEAYSQVKVVATAKSANYSGSNEETYTVAVQDISKAKVVVKAKPYTGKEITLTAEDFTTIKVGDTNLKVGVHYEIVEDSYANNINKGTASVTIKGIGNYAGTKKVTFKITGRTVAWVQNLFKW